MKIPVASLLPDEISGSLSLRHKYQGTQIFKWVQSGTLEFQNMTNLSKELRRTLYEKLYISSGLENTLTGSDGTVKLKIKLEDASFIEAVLLTDRNGRKTACLSVQAGCGMGCAFCRTGKMGLKRNLKSYEIVEQMLFLVSGYGRITNIVFMGMGEPLENLENLRRAVEIFHHPGGCGISFRKITVSTCGIVPKMYEMAENGPHTRIALSLITADPVLRSMLVPANRRYPLKETKDALLYYQKKTGKRITLEIVLLKGVNDRAEDMESLLKFIPPLKVVVNIIPWNPAEDIHFKEPSPSEVLRFKNRLVKAGVAVTERYRRGRGINGACGQLCVIDPALK